LYSSFSLFITGLLRSYWNLEGVRRVLFRLQELLKADPKARVYIVEGEKDVKRLVKLGLVATTNSGGAGKWQPEYNRFLKGRRVVILPDNDEPGRSHAEEVARNLAGVAKSVKIVHLPHLPDKGDVSDWLQAGGTRKRLVALVKKAPEYRPARLHNPVTTRQTLTSLGVGAAWEPFPVEVFPEPVRSYTIQGSRALRVDPAYFGAVLLPTLAAAVGNHGEIELKRSWREPAVVWASVVAESGSLKSPSFHEATRPVRRRQAAAVTAHEEKIKVYAAAQAKYEEEYKRWKKSKAECDPPDPPEEPVLERLYCSDVTVEALAVRLEEQRRGLLLMRDELGGWLGSFDAYKRGKVDVNHWLTFYNARDLTVDRKNTESPTLFVPRAAVSIVGTITPGAFRRALGEEHVENGLAARLLVVMPPQREKRWTDSVIGETVLEAMDRLFDRLYAMKVPLDVNGQPDPFVYELTGKGKRAWITFYNAHGQVQANATGFAAALLAKIEGMAARLALIIHLVRKAAGDKTVEPDYVDHQSVEAGVTLARWFAQEAQRVHGILAESKEEKEDRELAEWILRKGGVVRPSEVQQNLRRYDNDSDAVEAALNRLAKRKLGRWKITRPATGRPGRVFRLASAPAPMEPSQERDKTKLRRHTLT
jgi:hypothetical protein